MISRVIRRWKFDFQDFNCPSTATAMHCFMLVTKGVAPNTDAGPTADDKEAVGRSPRRNCDQQCSPTKGNRRCHSFCMACSCVNFPALQRGSTWYK